MQFCYHILRVGLALCAATGIASAQLTESFDGWTDDGSYAGTATYNHAGVGIWVSENALSRIDNARSGYAVRFNDDAPTPWLEFRGLDGNGIDGGVGTVSFYYRHWDGGSGDVAFQLQYRVGSGAWIHAGPETPVINDTHYRLFSRDLGLSDNNVTLRILSTENGERLLIDDFAIGESVGTDPVFSFVETAQTVSEGDGNLLAAIQIVPAAAATVDVAVVAGDATPGLDYTWSPSALVFTPGDSVQTVSILLADDAEVESTETVEWKLTLPRGGRIDPAADRFTLTLLDNDQVLNTNEVVLSIMAANITSGNDQTYESPGTRIFQALQPDIVAIQEFNTDHSGGVRGFVDDTFGTDFHYMIESGDEQIPNGVISRWPITASGEWNDPQVSNRDFAWATIDIPGDTDLHVISVHFHNSGGAGSRAIEAGVIVPLVQSSFPADDYIVIAGDFNTGSRTEGCIQTLKTVFVDTHVPADQSGDDDTNQNRNKPYDWVMVNPALDARHEPVSIGGLTFEDGLVFDTRLWSSPPAPALSADSGVGNMQHMAVMKAFVIPGDTPPPAVAAKGTPHAWLMAYGFTHDFDQAELTDTDADGMAAWEEYIVGTAPDDFSSKFSIRGDFFGQAALIGHATQPGRIYTIEWTDNLLVTSWQLFANPAIGVHTASGNSPEPHTFIDDFGPDTTGAAPVAGHRNYRIAVALLP